jgi:hypothetical protein
MRAPDHVAKAPLSDDELDQIARVTYVPEEHRPNMKYHVGFMVHYWVRLGGPQHLRRHGRGRGDERQLRIQVKRTAQAADKFVKELEEFMRLFKGLADPLEDGSILHRLQSTLDTAKWFVAASQSESAFWNWRWHRSRGRGRPLRSGKHQALYLLVGGLHELIEIRAQGRLAFWQDSTGKLKGALPSVLEILRPHLPDIVPKVLSETMLRRALKDCRRHRQKIPESSRFSRSILTSRTAG